MSFLSNLLTHAVAWGVQSLQWLVVLVGKTLLGAQHLLNWLDGAHPLATVTRPFTRFVQRHPKRIVAALASGWRQSEEVSDSSESRSRGNNSLPGES